MDKLPIIKSEKMEKSGRKDREKKRLLEYTLANNRVEKSFFEVRTIRESAAADPDLVKVPHSHNFYFIAWIMKGTGKHIIDFKEYDIQDGTVFFVSPGQVHLPKLQDRCKGYGIIFSENFLNSLSDSMRRHIKNEIFGTYRGTSICHIKGPDLEKAFENQILAIAEEREKGERLFGHQDTLSMALSSLIIFLRRYGTWENRPDYDEDAGNTYNLFLRFIDHVEDHFRKMREVKEYANALSVAVGTLNKNIKKASGKSPLEIINGRIILEAKRMLTYSPEMKVNQIAMTLGFPDSSNFVKYFRRVTGLNPGEYKNSPV